MSHGTVTLRRRYGASVERRPPGISVFAVLAVVALGNLWAPFVWVEFALGVGVGLLLTAYGLYGMLRMARQRRWWRFVPAVLLALVGLPLPVVGAFALTGSQAGVDAYAKTRFVLHRPVFALTARNHASEPVYYLRIFTGVPDDSIGYAHIGVPEAARRPIDGDGMMICPAFGLGGGWYWMDDRNVGGPQECRPPV